MFIPDGHQETLPDSDDIEERLLTDFNIDHVEWGPKLELTEGLITHGPHRGQRNWIEVPVRIGSRAQITKTGQPPCVYEVYSLLEDGPPLLRFVEGPG